ncbi:hypothetical protein C475_07951 [Halosimplex carlsbadense 2-9-1]|uniref:C2H2-type domain-containing protein n=1 Tax=Halosimplex carlsbadense 2-9-1 TaxID=797114 RepID=M0CUE1_9EURY|nr:DUF3105 domain-containing protein [Halosimplex carlsbadense]ELZ26851.1 hypothetical protein C475_07951 [Halosimplex carlsbadense 2-9-1]
MPDCDYCGATFDGEDAYLDHLAADHEGELGSIDRRRVAERDPDDDGGFRVGPAVLVGLLAVAGGLVVYVTFLMGGSGGTAAASGLPDSGDQSVVSQVQTEESNGLDHREQGTEIGYERVPPTSGAHWGGTWETAGFYTDQVPLESLVHSLEHGAVVVYYDSEALTPEAEENLRGWATNQSDNWRSFIAVPHPNEDPESAYVLTAWTKRLTMDEYDDSMVRAFTAEYLGRGPENPVR